MFLIIGPADMAKKQKTEMITYPILVEVISALKNAAFEANSLLLGYVFKYDLEKTLFKMGIRKTFFSS